MKKAIYFLLALCTSASAQDFEKQWNKVLALENLGKIKSAYEIVIKIEKKAVLTKNEAQRIKCFFYSSKYLQVLDEEAQTKIIQNLKKTIKEVTIPSKAVLNLIYGKCLNEYNMNDPATEVVNSSYNDEIEEPENINLLVTSEKEIDEIFEKTLENRNVLKNTPLTNYQNIFNFSETENFKIKTLLDYILQENCTYYNSKIQYWEIDRTELIKNEAIFYGDAKAFTQLNLDFINNIHLKKLLSLYQEIEINESSIENKFNRILYFKNNIQLSSFQCLEALKNLETETTEITLLQKIWYEQAVLQNSYAHKNSPTNYKAITLELLEKILKTTNKTNTYQNAAQLKHEIEAKTLSIQLQKQVYNQQNSRAFVQYKNMDAVGVSFYKINLNDSKKFVFAKEKNDSIAKSIAKKTLATHQKTYTLENKKDYFECTTELLMPTLEIGTYLVVFEDKSKEVNQKAFAFETITVSNLAVLAWQDDSKKYYQVVHRKTGEPIVNANLQILDNQTKTNKKGIASFEIKKLNEDLIKINNEKHKKDKKEEIEEVEDEVEIVDEDRDIVSITHKNDSLQINSNHYLPYLSDRSVDDQEKTQAKVEFYLDRAIYRPGQNVFYKGVAFKKDKTQTATVPFTSFKVRLKDVNGQEIKTVIAETNEFGSFSGEFILPKTGLTGNFTIVAEEPDDYENDKAYDKEKDEHPFWDVIEYDNSSVYFKVEEYKRPKFEVKFLPKKDSFPINELVKVAGDAKAFAGSTISDAKVNYTVVRFVQYYRHFYGSEQEEVIANGTTTTDAQGKFSVDFVAKPTENANKTNLPIFNYRVKASVTDINGETHDAETIVKVGYHDLLLTASVPNKVATKNKNEVQLNTTNLNGEFVATKGELKLYFVKKPTTKWKNRVWEFPEIEGISATDFERLFPFENNQKRENEENTLLFTKKINTETDKTVALDFIKNYVSGSYKIEFSAKDSFENLIETSQNFEIVQSEDTFECNTLFTAKQLNDDAKKDGFALVRISAAVPELFVNVMANYKNNLFYDEQVQVKKQEVVVKIPLENTFKNKLKIGFETVFENESYSEELEIALAEVLPKLEIEVSTFRNKLAPGSPENWSFQLKSNKNETEAEVLAAMYDSSLDQFTKTDWNYLKIYDFHNSYITFRSKIGFDKTYTYLDNLSPELPNFDYKTETTALNWFGFDFGSSKNNEPLFRKNYDKKEDIIYDNSISMNKEMKVDQVKFAKPILAKAEESSYRNGDKSKENTAPNKPETKQKVPAQEALGQVQARKNLAETAFFYPHLKTDKNGKVAFSFTSPEALTAWKLRLMAHNKAAVSGYLEKSVVTQKELMVVPNFPRFFREKDEVTVSVKIANITSQTKNGSTMLQLFDATTMQAIDAAMQNTKAVQNFSIAANGTTVVNWTLRIPEGVQGVQYKVVAKAGDFSDGEETILPVLTNSMLVTESIPVWVRDNSKKEYTFENLKNNTSTSLRNHQFTLEYTSNPTWLALQSLPYLMEYEHECAEQTFARFYANALATDIIASNPKIESLFAKWRNNKKIPSKLEDNEELKSIILAETPWLNDAQNEDEKKQKLAFLFDLEKMKTSQEATLNKLKQKQKSSGSFGWFDGSAENEYITRHILAGLGHLSKLTKNENSTPGIKEIAAKGVPYLDQKVLRYFEENDNKVVLSNKMYTYEAFDRMHYLYARSFYVEEYKPTKELQKVLNVYLENAKKHWLGYNLYEKGMAALALHRFGETATAKIILENLKETSSNNEDWGMYWIDNRAGWYWYQAPIETQALLIEAFAEITNDTKAVNAMKVWLLKNKQTKNWPTTKATTEAVYALLMQGTDWLSVKDNTVFKIGNEKIQTKKLTESQEEAETGYMKMVWKGDEIKKEMATITIENKSKVPGYGGIYWQYFEDLDKIKNDAYKVLSISKELYRKTNTEKGAKLEKITTENPLKVGDLVSVRLVITTKEPMEYVHLKDMRAACFEPVNVLSEYQYKDGLGYYQSTKDAATHFFFDYINKGSYVLEYDVRVNNLGDFSNGITTIQSMYAPEFSSHSKGIRVQVAK